eukprot:scaffold3651_cov104-Cylindrotheca_fusiformis.AAC.4
MSKFFSFAASAAVALYSTDTVVIPTTTLSNGLEFPLVGLGVGNLQHDMIEIQIADGVGDDEMQYRLIDTAHASHNENLIFDGVRHGLYLSSKKDKVHVITKVWYTHLGYERTMISVRESLEDLNSPDISVHILLHWPRCRDDIPWMDCASEEELLPQHVKDAGPPPHLNKETAFKESWRALEDLYLGKARMGWNVPAIASIGVSNFDLTDLKELIAESRVVPHILQGNVWSYLFEPRLLYFCFQMNIHFQVYNVMNGILNKHDEARFAFRSLKNIAREVSAGTDHQYTAAQVILRWLVQNDISVIPRTRDHGHLVENSAVALASMPRLTPAEEDRVAAAVRALLEGNDLKQPQVSFINQIEDSIVHIFWKDHHQGGKEHPVRRDFAPGEVYNTFSHTGHVFVAYDENRTKRREFQVRADYGQMEDIQIDKLFLVDEL